MSVTNGILLILLVFWFCSHFGEQFKLLHLVERFSKREESSDCKCGTNFKNRYPRLINGVPSFTSEFPWFASIVRKKKHFTSGSLISDRYVITGATAIYKKPQTQLSVIINKFSRNISEQQELTVGVLGMIVHPGYSPVFQINDLALLRLSSRILFHFNLIPICLPSQGVSYNGRLVTVQNFKDSQYEENEYLHKLELPVLPKNRCLGRIFDFEDCLGIIGMENIMCSNDSGAGVQYESASGYFELVGVMTAKQACVELGVSYLTKDIPVMTTVGNYLEWIYENTIDSRYCNKL